MYPVLGREECLLRVNVSRAFETPPIYWKYFENAFGSTVNNPDLSAEKAYVYETSLELRPAAGSRIKAALFRSDIKDAINTVDIGGGTYMKQNFEKFRQEGAELELDQDFARFWELRMVSGFNDVRDTVKDEPVRGRGVARQYFKPAVAYRNEKLFDATLSGRYERWDSGPGVYANDRKFVWDAFLKKSWFRQDALEFATFFNVYNLGNSKYWYDSDFPIPGRFYEGGVEIKF